MADASARGAVATGPRRGCRIVRVRGSTADVDAFVMGRLCAQVEGYNLQAATRVGANDRQGLERMAAISPGRPSRPRDCPSAMTGASTFD